MQKEQPKPLVFKPQDDITVQELAQIVSFFFRSIHEYPDQPMPKQFRRHFEEKPKK